jgi:purine-binding chemotaxis protein CheW
MNVVMQAADRPVSLLVDEIGDMVEVDDACFEPPPENLTGIGSDLILGAYKLPRRLLLALDPDKTIDLANETSEAPA